MPEEIAKHEADLNLTQRTIVRTLADQLRPAMVAQAMNLLDSTFPALKKSLFEQLGGALGIFSLSEIPNNLLMWAHYAANHTGFVIEFDESHTWFSAKLTRTDEFRHLRKVRYMDQPPSAYLAEWSGHDVFYGKLNEWKYEEEWRIIRPLQEASSCASGDIYLFQVPPRPFGE